MLWVTGDHHFGHKNIIAYDSRPFDNVRQMDEVMVRRWNEVVKKDDTVYHLGDFALASFEYAQSILARLNGKKILILGNHDRSAGRMCEMGFDEVHKMCVLNAEPGFYEDMTITYPSTILLTHYPTIAVIDEENKIPQMLNVAVNGWDYYPIPMPRPRGWLVIHGHSHNGRLVRTIFRGEKLEVSYLRSGSDLKEAMRPPNVEDREERTTDHLVPMP